MTLQRGNGITHKGPKQLQSLEKFFFCLFHKDLPSGTKEVVVVLIIPIRYQNEGQMVWKASADNLLVILFILKIKVFEFSFKTFFEFLHDLAFNLARPLT
jgi:hypothetical protein